jgi:hypothetical protein
MQINRLQTSSKYSLGIDRVTKQPFMSCKKYSSSDDNYWDPNNYRLTSNDYEDNLEKSEPWTGGKLFRTIKNGVLEQT